MHGKMRKNIFGLGWFESFMLRRTIEKLVKNGHSDLVLNEIMLNFNQSQKDSEYLVYLAKVEQELHR